MIESTISNLPSTCTTFCMRVFWNLGVLTESFNGRLKLVSRTITSKIPERSRAITIKLVHA